MPRILALDTATEACSVALGDGEAVFSRYQLAPRKHARLLLPMVESVLDEAGLAGSDLDALAFGRGPGSFTGVRIATSVVQGLAFAWDLPVIGVSDLAALAMRALREDRGERVYCALDARMDEVYFAAYEDVDGLPLECVSERVCPPDLVPQAFEDDRSVKGEVASRVVGVGSGFGRYREVLMSRLGALSAVDEAYFPDAADLLPLALADWHAGAAVAAYQAQPLYLRDQVAKKATAL